jgi:hypothetical protein
MGKPVNSWQAVVHDLIHSGFVIAKRIAFRLHADPDYLSDICRRDRIDPFAVCNEILKQADEDFQRQRIPLQHYQQVYLPVLALLLDGTHWMAQHVGPDVQSATSYTKLCAQVGILCEDLGGTVKALAAIEDDGKYNEQDDVNMGEFDVRAGQLISRVQAMRIELHKRHAARVEL